MIHSATCFGSMESSSGEYLKDKEERSRFLQIMVQSSLCTYSSGFNFLGLAIKIKFLKNLWKS
jgi:hypothetical protein